MKSMLFYLPFALFFVLMFSIHNVYAIESQTVEVEIKYTNGDRVDFNGVKLLVYQDFNKNIFLEQQLENNPDTVFLPTNHKYKIEIFANGVYADVEYIELKNNPEKITFNIPLSGGLKFNVYYNDGLTPVEGARVVIKSNDNTPWRQGITNSQGETMRFWIQSITRPDDYYVADIFLGELFLKSQYPIKLQQGISQNEKVVLNIPKIVQDLITVTAYKDPTTKISSSDEKHIVTLTNLYDEQSVSSEINYRGDAFFSNLKSGVYRATVTPDPNENWPEINLEIIGNINKFNIVKIPNTNPESEGTITSAKTESCNCIAFRFDDVQDYWLNDVQIEFMNTFAENDVPLTIGIIADSFGNDSKLLNFVKDTKNKKSFEIANHGMGNDPFIEFSKEEQDSRLKSSTQKIKDVLGVDTKVFIPPQNRFNDDTKQVLIDNGFTHISSSLLHGDSPPFPLSGETLYRFPQISTTGVFDSKQNIFVGVLHEETFEQTIQGIEKYGFAVIVSHPQEFSTVVNGTYVNKINSQQISELEFLLNEIQSRGIKIVPVGEINLDSKVQLVPSWIKNNAGWWASGEINDETFVQGIQYLVREKIITVSETPQTGSNQQVPSWIKNNAGWWASGEINDETFVQGIEYLVKNGIITY